MQNREGKSKINWKSILSRNEMWCAADNPNYMCHMCTKGFLDLNFKQLLTKYQIFKKLPQISHIHKNHNF